MTSPSSSCATRTGRRSTGLDDPNFYRKSAFQTVDKVEAIDTKTVKVTISKPDPFFLNVLAGAYSKVQAPEAIKAFEKDYANMSADMIIGTGAFVLDGVRRPKASSTLDPAREVPHPGELGRDQVRSALHRPGGPAGGVRAEADRYLRADAERRDREPEEATSRARSPRPSSSRRTRRRAPTTVAPPRGTTRTSSAPSSAPSTAGRSSTRCSRARPPSPGTSRRRSRRSASTRRSSSPSPATSKTGRRKRRKPRRCGTPTAAPASARSSSTSRTSGRASTPAVRR